MATSNWCKTCNAAVDTTVQGAAALTVVPLVGIASGALFGATRKKRRLFDIAMKAAVGWAVGYAAKTFLVPRLQSVVCAKCAQAASAS